MYHKSYKAYPLNYQSKIFFYLKAQIKSTHEVGLYILIFDNLAIVGCDVVAHVNRAGVLSDTHEGKQCELLMN